MGIRMTTITLDKIVYNCLLLYALASSISIAAANVGVSLALLFALIRYYKEPFRFVGDWGLTKAILLFWVTILISAIFAYAHPAAFSKLWAYIYRALPFFLAATFIDTPKKLFTVLAVMAVSLFIADGASAWQGIRGDRAVGFASMAMILAGYLLQMIPVLAVLALEETRLSRRTRLLFGGVVLISLMGMVFSSVRGAWIALFAVICLYLLVFLRARARMLAALAVILVIVFVGVSFPVYQARLMSTFNPADQSRTERFLVWDGAWRMFKDHPLVGVGPANFEDIYLSRYISPLAKERLGHAHNNFLHILAENGIVGFIGFIGMYSYILFYLYRRGREGNTVALGVFLATIALLIQGLTEYNFGDSAVIRMFWFLLGLAVANSRIGMGARKEDTA